MGAYDRSQRARPVLERQRQSRRAAARWYENNDANWQQYKAHIALGMIKLFQGLYQWKIPLEVEIDSEPARYGNLPTLARRSAYGGE